MNNKKIKVGIDIGSTTVKVVAIGEDGRPCFMVYERHNAQAGKVLSAILRRLQAEYPDCEAAMCLTGSVGMGVAQRCGLPFVQEVVAATQAVQERWPQVRTLIDIGGEDAKVVFFRNGKAEDLRMNGNCAGGTGAFIDQMALLLGVQTADLGALADKSKQIYPIASRCGVFSKTDVQNLLARGVSREDIAASVFHAVAVQAVATLAHGCDIELPILFCGGPLTFIPALRRAFANYLKISEEEDTILPSHSHLIPAFGAAIIAQEKEAVSLSSLIGKLEKWLSTTDLRPCVLPPIFQDKTDYEVWEKRMTGGKMEEAALQQGRKEIVIGIDSGSTTTKVVVLDRQGHLLFRYYHSNDGNPIQTALQGLLDFQSRCEAAGCEPVVTGSCSTGYGEDLLRAAFGLDYGIIETIAHYTAARLLTKDVSFILDIGGQDMKAIFVNGGVIDRMEINEACSSGCGSFIETFARSLGFSVEDFARAACRAKVPYDLGTRCTVFMNSKVKQALREGASVEDIAAGLSYSVVKNCLYKVLRLKSTAELGEHIVVQGGTMKNDSVVRAFEKLTERKVFRSSMPELMGALGCAHYALSHGGHSVPLSDLLKSADFTTREQQCHGCNNQCRVTVYRFHGERRYYAGNRCEKVFTNQGGKVKRGVNAYEQKLHLLFDRPCDVPDEAVKVGIPRCLNMYEEYPFWHTLFTACGLRPVLSAPSSYNAYESCARHVMSDNICFPAKLVHAHIQNLVEQGVSRIFMPFVVYEKADGGQNSYNCPIVSGYSEVVKGTDHGDVPVDSPAITFKDGKLLFKQCLDYLTQNFDISRRKVERAFGEAVVAYRDFGREMAAYDRKVLEDAKHHADGKRLVVLLAGRPYHADPLVQHKLADMVCAMGADVITEDIARDLPDGKAGVNYFSQWVFAHRILKAAEWAAEQDSHVQFMEMTSFGCGPDAFLTDEIRSLLQRHGKFLALLKIDDICNTGSLKLRVRSVIDSLQLLQGNGGGAGNAAPREEGILLPAAKIFEKEDRRRTIIAPFFTPFISPLLPSLVGLMGYRLECLPESDPLSADLGLKLANNEVCYPATLIVGDIIKAFKVGGHDPASTAVIMTQTGGQCRATNYISLIRRALSEAGLGDVPLISLATGSGIENKQPGFKVDWLKILPITVVALLYSDALAKFYYASVVREREEGLAQKLLKECLGKGAEAIARNDVKALWKEMALAAEAFNLITTERTCPRVGVVGEIFLKFNPFAQRNTTYWLIRQGIEVVPPMLTDFFLQSFVNIHTNTANHLERKKIPTFLLRLIYNKVWKQIERANSLCRRFRYFSPFESIWSKAEEAGNAVSLYAQFGEGWLLPAEVISLYRGGTSHVVSLQPFGCIANHIVAKGLERRIKRLCPGLNFLSLDFDSGVSEVNIHNRLLLFIDELKKEKNNYGKAI